MKVKASSPVRNGSLVEMEGITKVYGMGSAAVHALGGVDLRINQGEFCLLYTSDAADE